MPIHIDERGRLDLPFVGIATFARSDCVADGNVIDGNVALPGGLMEPADSVSRHLFPDSDTAQIISGQAYRVDRDEVTA